METQSPNTLSHSAKKQENSPILLFDGVCNLCNGLVQFTIERDPQGKFKFASLQSNSGQSLLKKFNLPTDDFDSFVLVNGDKHYTKSTASLRVAKGFGGFWALFYGFIIIPKPLRDSVYNLIARNRYRWFGKQETCWMPTPELKARFLE